jgi:vancomycin resistance protein VanJ
MTRGSTAAAWVRTDRGRRWAVVPGVLVLTSLVTLLLPQRSGPLALFEALAPLGYGALSVLLPLVALRRSGILAVALLGAFAFAWLAYGPPAPASASSTGTALTVMSWNLHGDDLGAVGFAALTARVQPDILVLQEAALHGRDDTLVSEWPYRFALRQAGTPPGMVILSRLPFEMQGLLDMPAAAWDRPRAPWIRVMVGDTSITIVGVHLEVPFASLPCPYCPDARDAQVAAVADFASGLVASGERVVVAGDFNLTEREPAYRDLGSILADAGDGAGATWRPAAAAWLPPLLRLDHVFASRGLSLSRALVSCAGTTSDHCPLIVTLDVSK